jgi:dolichyl-diphosphooligosaccharide---protein glycosyltransferase
MSIVPAHLMRSIGGGYDNESVAMTAMCLTFLLWNRALRVRNSLVSSAVWGIAAGLASFYMAAAWGGYVFVVNLVGIHAAVLFILGYFSPNLHMAYSCMYFVGTMLAMQIPVISQAPIRSLEQAGPLLVFLVFQFCRIVDSISLSYFNKKWTTNGSPLAFTDPTYRAMLLIRFQAALVAGALTTPLIVYLAQTGYFGPLSVRVKALFVKHTKTGNPLVDSVAEHQAASAEAYWHHLHYSLYCIAPGIVLSFTRGWKRFTWALPWNGTDSLMPKFFPIVYFTVAYYFANKMSRLILLMAPVASVLAGITLGWAFEWCCIQVLCIASRVAGYEANAIVGGDKGGIPFAPIDAAVAEAEKELALIADAESKKNDSVDTSSTTEHSSETTTDETTASTPTPSSTVKNRKPTIKKTVVATHSKKDKEALSFSDSLDLPVSVFSSNLWKVYSSDFGLLLRLTAAVAFFIYTPRYAVEFYRVSDAYAHQVSHPSLMFKAKLQDGSEVMVNDYQEAYWWLRDNTPADSRVLSWWDYGYQINGIAKRTSIADGNTWNLEHIAMLGRMLTAPEKKAHSLVRLIADYVLIWSGGGGDDLAKSPHMARISSSVFDDVCGPDDPLCRNFGFWAEGKPTPSMEASMLYKMHSADLPGKGGPPVQIDKKLFQEAYKSRYGLVRIWKIMNVSQETRTWLADPANRQCDRPGSWYCPGQYPPPSITGGIKLSPPSTHRHLDYDNPHAYVEDAKRKSSSKASSASKAKKSSKK